MKRINTLIIALMAGLMPVLMNASTANKSSDNPKAQTVRGYLGSLPSEASPDPSSRRGEQSCYEQSTREYLSSLPSGRAGGRLSCPFTGRIYNKEYDVYIVMNFEEQNVTVPGNSIYGELPGYFGDSHDGRKWLFTAVTMEGCDSTSATGCKARLEIVNDYGSEDLTAELKLNSDGTYSLRQLQGSRLKIARNRKWVKMPKEMIFKR